MHVRFPIRLLTVAAFLTTITFVWFGWVIFDAHRDRKEFTEKVSHIERIRGDILQFDEILTMSAHMAAVTGESKWEERYRRYEPQLDDAIQRAVNIGEAYGTKAAVYTNEANTRLVEMENRVFALVRDTLLQDAQAVLNDPNYALQKRVYADGVASFSNEIRSKFERELADDVRLDLLSIIAALVVGGVSLAAWFSTACSVRRWHVQLLNSVQRHEAAEAKLRQAQAVLEDRVKERTADLARTNESLRKEITERNRIERDLEFARDMALESTRMKSEFLANMSHEIRTPMNGIIGMTDLVLGTQLDREQREYVGMAKSSADALLTLLNDILDFSKIEAGKLELESVNFAIRDCIGSLLKPLQVRAEQKGLSLVSDIAADVPNRLLGDPARLRQILMNLLDNAIKFTKDGGVKAGVSVDSVSNDKYYLHFTVADTGIGIPDEKHAIIFEAFAQADGTTTRIHGGTGLGLAIASQLVQKMDGRIWVDSMLGKGATFHFTVRLPIANEALPAEPGADSAPAPRCGSPLRILLAEDNVVNRAIATRILESAGHSLVHAANGIEAVEAATRETFDLIFMDVQMPEMDGLEATRRIREYEQATGRHTPISAMTAHAMTGDRERCLAAGMDHYITKPLKKAELFVLLDQIAANQDRARAPGDRTWSEPNTDRHGALAPV